MKKNLLFEAIIESFLNPALGQRGKDYIKFGWTKNVSDGDFIFILRWWLFIRATSAAHRGRF